ncbi:DUF4192 domain-containing protein [Marinactinospora endophytica]
MRHPAATHRVCMVTQRPPGSPVRLPLATPTDIIAAVPYLLGRHPSHCLVVLGARGAASQVRLAGRCPLPEEATAVPGLVAGLVERLARDRCDQAVLVGYGPPERVAPFAHELGEVAAASGVALREALRVDGGRYWSYLCPEPACCPPEGTRYDVVSSTIPATAVLAGLAPRGGSAVPQALVAPVAGSVRDEMERATRRAEVRRGRMCAEREGAVPVESALLAEGARAVAEAVDDARAGRLPGSCDRVAWLGVLLATVSVRDEAWARIRPPDAAAHVRLWRYVLRRVEPSYTPAPGALLAFAAWQQGDTALADAALDRVDSASPGYPMAVLLRQALQRGVSPRDWPQRGAGRAGEPPPPHGPTAGQRWAGPDWPGHRR